MSIINPLTLPGLGGEENEENKEENKGEGGIEESKEVTPQAAVQDH